MAQEKLSKDDIKREEPKKLTKQEIDNLKKQTEQKQNKIVKK